MRDHNDIVKEHLVLKIENSNDHLCSSQTESQTPSENLKSHSKRKLTDAENTSYSQNDQVYLKKKKKRSKSEDYRDFTESTSEHDQIEVVAKGETKNSVNYEILESIECKVKKRKSKKENKVDTVEGGEHEIRNSPKNVNDQSKSHSKIEFNDEDACQSHSEKRYLKKKKKSNRRNDFNPTRPTSEYDSREEENENSTNLEPCEMLESEKFNSLKVKRKKSNCIEANICNLPNKILHLKQKKKNKVENDDHVDNMRESDIDQDEDQKTDYFDNQTLESVNANSFKELKKKRKDKGKNSMLSDPKDENKLTEKESVDCILQSTNEKRSPRKRKNLNKQSNQRKDIPHTSKGRHYTVSIAVPSSILEETCLLNDLKVYVVGQIARAVCIYSVDEIVIYNDKCTQYSPEESDQSLAMMKMILEYLDCPQYLRRDFFPIHPFLGKAGIISALNASHHLLINDWCTYREGVVLPSRTNQFSYANIGLRKDVELDRKVDPGLRVTVKLPPVASTLEKMFGSVVSPEEPRLSEGLYWGYTVRIANSLSEVFKSERFDGGYDLIIGTSDKGDDAQKANFKKFSHALIVFGGVHGLEAALEADEEITKTDPKTLFPHYLNVCPNQTSRTIRTEEAILISLCVLTPKLRTTGIRVK